MKQILNLLAIKLHFFRISATKMVDMALNEANLTLSEASLTHSGRLASVGFLIMSVHQ